MNPRPSVLETAAQRLVCWAFCHYSRANLSPHSRERTKKVSNLFAMQKTPAKIAARLMAPASSSAYWSSDQVKKLIIEAISEERGDVDQRPARKGKTG